MKKYWDERARVNAAWYVDTSLSFEEPDMTQFFATGQRLVEEILRNVPDSPVRGGTALEIGCGLGRICRALAPDFDHVVGVDISPEMVERATALVPECEFRVSDGATLAEFGDDSVDLVVTFTVFQHIPDREIIRGYVREIGRVLKPGGTAFIQWNGSQPSLMPGRTRLLTRFVLGRRDARATDVPEFQGTCVPKRVMQSWIREAGLSVVAEAGGDTLWAQFWATKLILG